MTLPGIMQGNTLLLSTYSMNLDITYRYIIANAYLWDILLISLKENGLLSWLLGYERIHLLQEGWNCA